MRITLAVAILPAIALIYLFKKWDEKRPEPPGMVRNAVLLGMVSCVPAVIIELALSAALGKQIVEAQGQFVNSFVIAAGTEEAVKLAVVMFFFWKKEAFNEVMDGILYCAAASLGFALLENVLYAGNNLFVGLARAISAVPLHATCSGIMGYFVGRAKMNGGAFGRIAAGYAIAVFIHGLYDWAVFSGGGFGFAQPQPLLGFAMAVGIVVVCAIVLKVLVSRALKEDDLLLGAHARPLERPMPYHLVQRGYGAPYGHPGYHPQPPAPYGMHTPYGAHGGHVPAPHAPAHGWHHPPQPHAYPQHGHGQGPHAQQPYAPPPHAQQPHAPQQGWGAPPQGGYGPGGGWPPPGST